MNFLNNAYPFPAKPRNQWEIGVKGGISSVAGDVRSIFPTGGFGIHVRKALGYVFSLSVLNIHGTVQEDLNFSSSQGFTRGTRPGLVQATMRQLETGFFITTKQLYKTLAYRVL